MPTKKSTKKRAPAKRSTSKKAKRTVKKRTAPKKPEEEVIEEPLVAPVKTKKRRLWIWVVVLLLLVGGVALAWFLLQPRNQPVIVTEVVRRGSVVQTVEATGELESIDQVDLSFSTPGTVEAVFAVVGDMVDEGTVLARLEAVELDADVDKARQSLQAAQAQLDLERAGASSEEISIQLANVNLAEAALTLARTTLENEKQLGQQGINSKILILENANDDLVNTLAENEQDIQQAKDDLISTMSASMISVRAAISAADEVLGVDNALINDAYEDALSSQDPTQLGQAESAFAVAVASRDAAESIVYSLTSLDTISSIDVAADAVEDAFADADALLLETREVLDASTAGTSGLTVETYLALIADNDAARNDLQTKEAAFVMDRSDLSGVLITTATAEDNARNAIGEAEDALDQANIDRDTRVAAAESDIVVKEADLEKAKATLTELQADPRFVDVASFIADVRAAEAELEAALARRAEAEILSPISGRVTNVELEVGEVVAAASIVITVQTLEDQFRIVADVPEADIPKIAVDQSAKVEFDAFGDDVIFDAVVRSVDPAEKEVEGVIFYEAEVELLDQDIVGLRPGLSVDVTVLTAQVDDTVFVPQRAILEQDGQKFVRVLTSGTDFEERFIEVGLRGDDGLTQIVSGLEVGEEVIVTIRE